MKKVSLHASAIFSLFSLVTSFTSDSNSQNSQNAYPMKRPLTSSNDPKEAFIPLATFVVNDSDFQTIQQQQNQQRRRRQRETKAVRPPLVDSDLLRFLNAQKKLKMQAPLLLSSPSLPPQQTQSKKGPLEEANSNEAMKENDYEPVRPFSQVLGVPYLDTLSRGLPPTTIFPKVNETIVPAVVSGEQNTLDDTESADQTLASDVDEIDSVDYSWLGQYNHHRVASVLQSRAKVNQEVLDPKLAARAGERVQSQALARTARRRVRTFLKERDREWSATIAAPTTSTAATATVEVDETLTETSSSPEMTAADSSTLSYGFEDTVDLLLEYGLTTKDICEILIHSPGVALMRPRHVVSGDDANSNGESLQETVDRVFVSLLSETLSLRKYDARKVLRTCPSLLTMRGSKSAEQVVKIMSRLDVSTTSLTRDKNVLTTFLLRPPSALFRFISFLASDAVRMPIHKIGPLLRRAECQPLLDVVAPVPQLETREFGMLRNDDTDPGVVMALWGRGSQERRELVNEIYRNMTKTAWTLRHEIGTADLGKVIAAYPSVLTQDAENQILPAAKFLMHELGIWEDDLPRVLQLYPALLGVEIEQMKKVADYLLSLEVEKESLGSIFRSFPALLTHDVEKEMAPVVEFLRNEVGIRNIGRFITRLPTVLTYSIEGELKPKWAYLQNIYVDPRFEATKFPAYFSYPLERVIKTRFSYLKLIKMMPTQLTSLDLVLCNGDKDFATKVAGDKDNGQAFAEFAEQRRKAKLKESSPRKLRRKSRQATNNDD